MGDILHMYTISTLYMAAVDGTIEFGERHVRVTAKDYEAAASLASEQIGNDLKINRCSIPKRKSPKQISTCI